MNTQKHIEKINSILKKIIDKNLTGFKKSGEFKVRPGYGYDKFYLDSVEGSYDMSLQSLIHYIMYSEWVYKEILNKKQYAELEIMIKESPEGIYSPNIDFESDDYSESEDTQEILDEIYHSCIKYVGEQLIEKGFDVESTFADFLGIVRDDKEEEDFSGFDIDDDFLRMMIEREQKEDDEK